MNPLLADICGRLGVSNIEDAVDRIVEQTLSQSRQFDWPVSLEAVCSTLNIARIEVRPIACDGMLIPLGCMGYRVVIASWASRARQRFSLAHELGHAIVHRLVPETRKLATRSVFAPPGNEAEEKLCDMLASRLLMPTAMMKTFAERHEFGLAAIRELAAISGASLSAAAIRACGFWDSSANLSLVKQEHDGVSFVRQTLMRSADRNEFVFRGGKFKRNSLTSDLISTEQSGSGWDWVPVGRTAFAKRFVEVDSLVSGSRLGLALVLSSRKAFVG